MNLPDNSSPASDIAYTAKNHNYDVLVVGGGINGTGIARDLAGRGLRVILCERDDLASHTSSSSTKLIHGGLRYLESYNFAFVRKALLEREILLKSAPHIMRPMRFIMPHNPSMRPVWMIRLGLFLYDHLAKRKVLPASRLINLKNNNHATVLKDKFTRGFEYSDVWVDDARLVVLNALDAKKYGAKILTQTACVAAKSNEKGWQVTLEHENGSKKHIQTRTIINATGPWAESFLHKVIIPKNDNETDTLSLRLVKGSHIIIPRCFDHEKAYIFQNDDNRIMFAIPYEKNYTLLGTTDLEYHDDPRQVDINDDEIKYICEHINLYFKKPITAKDIVWSYAGVRPLLDSETENPSSVTRDYKLETTEINESKIMTIWGGKLTTYRKLSEEAADEIAEQLGHKHAAWTNNSFLPGGDLSKWISKAIRPDIDFSAFIQALTLKYPWLATNIVHDYARAYGARINLVLGEAKSCEDLGQEIAPDLYECELRYLCREEWAKTADDVLWRRRKLGLHYTEEMRKQVAKWFKENPEAYKA